MDTHARQSAGGRLRSTVRHLIDELPESLRFKFIRARHPKRHYFFLLPTDPISRSFGADRGTPIDRNFIERFLHENRSYIRGDCLEVQNADYLRRFGRDLARVDILDIDRSNTSATVYGDLCHLDSVADSVYDCLVITQVFQYVHEPEAAVRETWRSLKPGGTALVTLPAIHKCEKRAPHFWKYTAESADYLFTKHFPTSHVTVGSLGNALTSMAFWVGLAQEDLRRKDFDVHDPDFPCTITVRATKPN
jgi:SAM-dependent methyltransferase